MWPCIRAAALLKTNDIVGVDGVGVGVFEAAHGLVEAVEFAHVVIGGRHDFVAVHALAPLGAEHLGLGLAGLWEVAHSSVGDGEVSQRLTSCKVHVLGRVEIFLHAAEAFGMAAQFIDAFQCRLANRHHLGETHIVYIDANQIFRDRVVSSDTFEGIQLTHLGEGVLQSFDTFVGLAGLGHRLGNESLGFPYFVEPSQLVSQA